MKELLPGELGELGKALHGASLRKIEVPKNVMIPGWPAAAAPATLSLGRRDYQFPTASRATGLIRIERRQHSIEFIVYKNGAFGFSFLAGGKPSRTDARNDIERLQALFLFHQFKTEICEKLACAIQRDSESHNEAAEAVSEALETFLPYLIADAFTWEE